MKIDQQLVRHKLSLPLFDASILDSRFSVELRRSRERPVNMAGIGNLAAVLILIFDDIVSNRPYIVLTQRRADLSHHGGQVSLPGGRQDPDELLVQTAKRESAEEIGVDASRVEILGELSPVYVPPSDFTIHPFVGWYSGPADFKKSEDEVAEILYAPVEQLVAYNALKTGPIQSEKRQIVTAFYQFGEHQVWGATAKILYELGLRLAADE